MINHKHYVYRIIWSAEDEEFMGLGIDKKPAFEEYCIELQS